MHHDYPIEQLARSATTRFQIGFARVTMHLMPEFEDAVLEPSEHGSRILGTSEGVLASPRDVIRQIDADRLQLNEPRVRPIYDTAVREPVMWVRATMDFACIGAVVQDLVRRSADIHARNRHSSRPVVRAQAPRRALLGYPQDLSTLSGGTADLRMWPSHYAPVPPTSGGAAA
jgi:hypothetical protein